MTVIKKRSREAIKMLIELSPTVEAADKIIVESLGFETVEEKIAFLKGMFDVESIGHANDTPDETTYFSILNAIISR